MKKLAALPEKDVELSDSSEEDFVEVQAKTTGATRASAEGKGKDVSMEVDGRSSGTGGVDGTLPTNGNGKAMRKFSANFDFDCDSPLLRT